MRFSVLLLSLILCVAPAMAAEKPGPAVNWLMKTPMSLWDFKMFELSEFLKHLQQLDDYLKPALIWPAYYPDINRIRIVVLWPDKSTEIGKEACAKSVRHMREIGRGPEGTRGSLYGIGFESLDTLRELPRPHGVAAEIDGIIEIHVTQTSGETCWGPLNSTEILFENFVTFPADQN